MTSAHDAEDREIITSLERAVYFLDEDCWPTLYAESRRKADECSRVACSLTAIVITLRARLKRAETELPAEPKR